MTNPASISTQKTGVHPPIAKLRQALSFKVARLAALNERAGNFHFEQSLGIRLNEWRVLGLIVPERTLRFSKLRELLWIDKGQLSRIVKSMVDQGLIENRVSHQDARQIELYATARGRNVHDQALRFTQSRNEAVVETLTPAECAQFLEVLDKILYHNEDLARQQLEGQ